MELVEERHFAALHLALGGLTGPDLPHMALRIQPIPQREHVLIVGLGTSGKRLGKVERNYLHGRNADFRVRNESAINVRRVDIAVRPVVFFYVEFHADSLCDIVLTNPCLAFHIDEADKLVAEFGET